MNTGCEMDSETKVKEEINLLEEETSIDKDFSSSSPERIFECDATVSQYDFKMDHKINIKKEVDILEPGLPNESACFSTDFGNEFKNDTNTHSDFELHTEAKELAFVSDTCFQKEEKCFSLDLVKKIKKEFIMHNENGEVCVQRMSIETEWESEPSDSSILLQSENKYRKPEDLDSADSYRLIADTTCHETPRVEAMEPSQIAKNVYTDRSKKNIENDESGILVLHSKKQDLINNPGIQCEHFVKGFPGKSAFKLCDLIPEEKNVYNCDNCQQNFVLQQTNSLIHEGKKPHKRNLCNKSFLQLGSLKVHSLIHEGKKPHKCNVCNKSFTQIGNLRKHSLIHEGKKPHKCNVCNKSFTHPWNLRRHCVNHEGKKPHKCTVCNKSFTQLGNLRTHSLIHEGTKPHKCNVCNKSFTRLANLRKHSLIHEGKKPHKCNFCNKSFTDPRNLRTHSLIHEGTKPHKCNVCNKSFTRLANLRTHRLIHEGTKPHKCNVCNKSFTRLGNLRTHRLIYEGKKPHK